MISQAKLKELVHYNLATGIFTCLKARGGLKKGDIVGTKLNTGYLTISLMGNKYVLHRLAYLYVVGTWPAEVIDHVNGIRDDNCWYNLRACSVSQNCINRPSKVGLKYKGVKPHRNGGWSVVITRQGKTTYLGYFKDQNAAEQAYAAAAKKLHGAFRHKSTL